ncbi:MAG TPA: MFS transporter [Chloroflexi bacterium]|nr:MFS transporter [Chloroflexota bacterium]
MSASNQHKWLVLAAVTVGLFLGAVDGSIVNIALPTLVHEFHTDFPTIQWVVLAFLLGLTTVMLGVGRLADMIGKKQIFTWGLVLFTAASALCGLSPTVWALIAFRLLQSIGAAMIVALGVAIVTEVWPPEERGQAIGTTGGVIALGIVVGPTLGGLLIGTLGWRAIFFVNLPFGLLALFLTLRFVPDLRPKRTAETFDWAGALVLGGGLLALSLALTVGQNLGFTDGRILALFAAAAVALVAFVAIEKRSRAPMIDLTLFRDPQFGVNLFTGFLSFVAIAGVVFLIPFYLELVLGLPVAQVGLLMAIVPTVMAVLGPLSGVLSDKIGTRPVSVLGLIAIFIGYMATATLAVDTTPMGYVLRMLPVGIGMGIFQSPNNSAIMGAAPRERLGIASGMLSMTRTLGQTAGIALLGAFFASRIHDYTGQPVDVVVAPPPALAFALHDQFHLAATLITLGLLVALMAWRRERRVPAAPIVAERQMPVETLER